MQSIGVVFKKNEMVIVSLKHGIKDIFLQGYRILPFLDFKDEEKEEAIIHNIERFVKLYKGGRDNLFIALPRDAALVQFLYLPLAVEENLSAAIGYEIDKHTPFSFDDVYFDYHVIRRMPESNLLHVALVTVKRDIVDYYLNLFKKLKIKPQGIELTTTALLNMQHQAASADEGVMQEPVPFSPAALKKRYFTYVLKISPQMKKFIKMDAPGNREPSISVLIEYLDDKSCELGITMDNALYYSQAVPCPGAGPADPEHFRELHERGVRALINVPHEEHIDGYRLHFMLSGREMEKGYTDCAPEELRESFAVLHRFPVRLDKYSEETLPSLLPVLAVPTGLALKGLQSMPYDLNLIPPQARPKRKKSKRKMMALIIGAFILLTAGGLLGRSIFHMKTELAVLNAEVGELKKQFDEIEKLQQEAQKAEQFAAALQGIRDAETGKLKILEELTRIIPEDSWLIEFNFKASEKKVTLAGFAVSASKLVPLLEESPLFENVKFTSPITTDKRSTKERFRLEISLSPQGNKT